MRHVSTALSQWRDTEDRYGLVAKVDGQQLSQGHVHKWSMEPEMH